MKYYSKILLVLFCFTLFISCSKDDNSAEIIVNETIAANELLAFGNNFSPQIDIDEALLPTPTLSWSLENLKPDETVSFEVKFGAETSNISLLSDSITAYSYQIDSLLKPESNYYWQVSFTNRDSTITTSDVQQFTTRPIEFLDASLEQIIRDVLSKQQGDFLQEEIANIKSIPLENEDGDYAALIPYELINNISGIQYCTNVERVNLMQKNFRSPITDISPLKNLKSISYLNLANNKVSDISPLADLENLENLHLGWNIGITDISPLTSLKNLKTLNLTFTHGLRDISALENLPQLDSLSLNSAYYLSDLSPITSLVNLKKLSLTGNDFITDLSILENLTDLRELVVFSNDNITDISALAMLTNLNKLNISNNKVTDISALENLTDLTYLEINDLDITDISVLAKLTNLQKLELHDNFVDDSIMSIQELREALPNTEIRVNGRFYQ